MHKNLINIQRLLVVVVLILLGIQWNNIVSNDGNPFVLAAAIGAGAAILLSPFSLYWIQFAMITAGGAALYKYTHVCAHCYADPEIKPLVLAAAAAYLGSFVISLIYQKKAIYFVGVVASFIAIWQIGYLTVHGNDCPACQVVFGSNFALMIGSAIGFWFPAKPKSTAFNLGNAAVSIALGAGIVAYAAKIDQAHEPLKSASGKGLRSGVSASG